MALGTKTLELAATSISIAAGCIPCTRYHIGEAGKAGAGERDVLLALSAGTDVAAIAGTQMAEKFEEKCEVGADTAAETRSKPGAETPQFLVLCRLGAAIAVNSVALVRQAIDEARAAGFTDTELLQIAVLARAIKEKAASHVARVTDGLDADAAAASAAGALCS